MRMEELRGIFWPVDVYKRVKGERPPKTMTIHSIPYSGRIVKGVMLDETWGRPVGSINIYGEDFKYIQKD